MATSPASWSMCSHEGDPRRSARRLQRFSGRVLRSPETRPRPVREEEAKSSSARKALFPGRSSPRTPEGLRTDDAERSPPRKPKARRRESPRDSSPPPPEKRARTGDEEAPKAKVALFGSPRGVSAEAFYGAPSPKRAFPSIPLPRSPAPLKPPRRNSGRWRPHVRGQVRHGVRRPKARSASRANEAALKEALRLMEDSPLNDYIADFFKNEPRKAGAEKRNFSEWRKAGSEPPDRSKAHEPDEFCEEAIEDGDDRLLVDRLLDEWADEELPSPRCLESIENTVRSQDAPVRADIVASGGAFYLVEASDSENSPVPCDADKLDAELEKLDREIFKIAKLNNIDPATLLSPTTEMCSMTSGLFLDSPGAVIAAGRQIRRIPAASSAAQKLFPVFSKNSSASERRTFDVLSDKLKIATNKRPFADTKNQYLIDAGQKKFGPTECKECGVVYQTGDASDEADHLTYHMGGDILRFNGWKAERFCGRWGEGRTLAVYMGDPPAHWQRVRDLLNRVVHPQLGYASALKEGTPYKVYLYIEKKLIVGCLVAEQLSLANKMMTHNNLECCSTKSYPVKCGVSRLWTHKAHRKKGVATKLMSSMRANFLFGHILTVEEIAFSSPTPMGKKFAEKYTANPNFYTYLS